MRRSKPPRKTVGKVGPVSCTVGLMSVPRPTPTPLTSTSTNMRRTRTPPRAEAEGVCKEGGRGPLALLAGSLDGLRGPHPLLASAAQQLGQSRCEVVRVAHQLDHFRPRGQP